MNFLSFFLIPVILTPPTTDPHQKALADFITKLQYQNDAQLVQFAPKSSWSDYARGYYDGRHNAYLACQKAITLTFQPARISLSAPPVSTPSLLHTNEQACIEALPNGNHLQ